MVGSACIVSCVSLWTRVRIKDNTSRTRDLIPANIAVYAFITTFETKNFYLTDVSSIVEMNVGMWVASMPACAGLINKTAFPFLAFFTKTYRSFASFWSRLPPPLDNEQPSSPKDSLPSFSKFAPSVAHHRPMQHINLAENLTGSRERLYDRWHTRL